MIPSYCVVLSAVLSSLLFDPCTPFVISGQFPRRLMELGLGRLSVVQAGGTRGDVKLREKALRPCPGDLVSFTDPSLPETSTPQIGRIAQIYPFYSQSSEASRESDAGLFAGSSGSSSQSSLESPKPFSFNVEITPLEVASFEDGREGYYREASWKKSRKTVFIPLNAEAVRPVATTFVRDTSSYKVPIDANGEIIVRGRYNLADYEGPESPLVDVDVVKVDGENYRDLKWGIIKEGFALGFGASGLVWVLGGGEMGKLVAEGVVGGGVYMSLLGREVDLVGKEVPKNEGIDRIWNDVLGKNFNKIRFIIPLLLLLSVSSGNFVGGGLGNGADEANFLSSVTKAQFASVLGGFAIWRLPVLRRGLVLGFGQDETDTDTDTDADADADTTGKGKSGFDQLDFTRTVLVLSGPTGSGKTSVMDGFFSHIESENTDSQFLRCSSWSQVKKAVEADGNEIVVVEANTEEVELMRNSLDRKTRIVGVWISLNDIDKFLSRWVQRDENVLAPSDADKEKFGKYIVEQISYGITSGIFEFTILNDDIDESVQQLVRASKYCLK